MGACGLEPGVCVYVCVCVCLCVCARSLLLQSCLCNIYIADGASKWQISGKVFKEFLIEYENDVEIGRRFITQYTKLEFLDDVLKMVARAEEIVEITVEIYEEMLD